MVDCCAHGLIQSAKENKSVGRLPSDAMEHWKVEDFTRRLGIIYAHLKLLPNNLLAQLHLTTELEATEKALREYHQDLIHDLCTKFEDLKHYFSSRMFYWLLLNRSNAI